MSAHEPPWISSKLAARLPDSSKNRASDRPGPLVEQDTQCSKFWRYIALATASDWISHDRSAPPGLVALPYQMYRAATTLIIRCDQLPGNILKLLPLRLHAIRLTNNHHGERVRIQEFFCNLIHIIQSNAIDKAVALINVIDTQPL